MLIATLNDSYVQITVSNEAVFAFLFCFVLCQMVAGSLTKVVILIFNIYWPMMSTLCSCVVQMNGIV